MKVIKKTICFFTLIGVILFGFTGFFIGYIIGFENLNGELIFEPCMFSAVCMFLRGVLLGAVITGSIGTFISPFVFIIYFLFIRNYKSIKY